MALFLSSGFSLSAKDVLPDWGKGTRARANAFYADIAVDGCNFAWSPFPRHVLTEGRTPTLTCFKAYDIRGRLGADLSDGIVRRIGRACVEALDARTVVAGRDCRASSEALMAACVEGLVAGGATVLDLGLCGSEEMYFAVTHLGADGGIEVAASHNPMDYNGMKLIRAGSAPLDAETGLAAIRALAEGPAVPDRPGGA